MIRIEDCLEGTGLTPEEIAAIAEHEHIPDIAAAGLGEYLLHGEHGAEVIRDMILDDLQAARARGDRGHMHELGMVLMHFLQTHPEACVHERAATPGGGHGGGDDDQDQAGEGKPARISITSLSAGFR